jgi:tetratricopeptide (TPR) repeat protein
MPENQTSPKPLSGKLLRLIVIGVGAILLVLLMLADKTNLNSQEGRTLEATARPAGASALPEGKLPPLAPDEELDAWIAELDELQGEAKKQRLDQIVERLNERKRYAYAAQYAEQAVALSPDLQAKLNTGRLYQQASRLEYIASDSVLFQQYANKAIQYLEEVTEIEPENEEGLYYLGLAYVESRNPQNSMKGILTIRKILEINPDNAEASYSLGMFSVQTGQFGKAEERFEKVLNLQPNNQTARYYLAYARVQQNKSEGVKALLEEVLAKASDPDLKQQARNLINQIN